MDYICFGNRQKNIIMIPCLGDELKTVKGTAAILAIKYREYAKNYKVYFFSRKNNLEEGYSRKDMAKDQAEAMKKLEICKASIIGVSQGGMITQYIAIDYPKLIDKLVLAKKINE